MNESTDERRILVGPARIADGRTRFVVKLEGEAMATWDTEPEALAFAVSVARRVAKAGPGSASVLRQDLTGKRVQEARFVAGDTGRGQA